MLNFLNNLKKRDWIIRQTMRERERERERDTEIWRRGTRLSYNSEMAKKILLFL